MQSQAQRGFLWANHPEVAREFEDKTPKGKKLPYHKRKRKKAASLPMTPEEFGVFLARKEYLER